ncbi:hypothetical protein GQ457_11G025250 [Hibiscus cannabinus]
MLKSLQKPTDVRDAKALRCLFFSHGSTLRALENQVGQIAQALQVRPQGRLPSDTELTKRNGKDQCSALTLRNGTTINKDVEFGGEENIEAWEAAMIRSKTSYGKQTPKAKLWSSFLKRNLMPTSHNQTVDRIRLVLINAILTGFQFNVGEVIAREISAACKNDKGILTFPCIIYALCRKATVPTSPGDKHVAEKSGWTRKEIDARIDQPRQINEATDSNGRKLY